MKKSKVLPLAFAALLTTGVIFSDGLPTSAAGTALETTIPDKHTVSMEIGEHGSIMIDHQEYTGTAKIDLSRHSTVTYTIIPETGYRLSVFEYNGQDCLKDVSGQEFTTPYISDDAIFNIQFVPENSETSKQENSSSPESSVQGSDENSKVTSNQNSISEGSINGESNSGSEPPVLTGDNSSYGILLAAAISGAVIWITAKKRRKEAES